MLPSQPLVVRCRGCGRYFWLSRGELLGSIEPFHFLPVPIRDVLFTDVGSRRVEVMAVVRRVLGVELHEAKALLEHIPLELHPRGGLGLHHLDELIKRYLAAGAVLTRYPLPPSQKPEPLPGEELPPEWLELPGLEELPESDLLAALVQGVTQDKDEERELRLKGWWAATIPTASPEHVEALRRARACSSGEPVRTSGTARPPGAAGAVDVGRGPA